MGIHCIECKKLFKPKIKKTRSGQPRKSKYCSKDCYDKDRAEKKWAKAKCIYCNKDFTYRAKQKNRKTCSLSCSALYGLDMNEERRAKVRYCKVCNKQMKIPPNRLRDGRGKYCSRKCYAKELKHIMKGKKLSLDTKKLLSEKRKGKDNPAYVEGNSYGYKKYKSQFPRYLKEQVLKRDNYTCQSCSSKESILVHHIDNNPLNSSLENLISWCRSCHSTHHRHLEYAEGRRKKRS